MTVNDRDWMDDDMRWDAHADFIEEDVLWEQDNTYVADRVNDMEDFA